MQSAGFYRPAGVTPFSSHPVSASAPTAQKQLSSLADDQLELTERDLWEDDAGLYLPTLPLHALPLLSSVTVLFAVV